MLCCCCSCLSSVLCILTQCSVFTVLFSFFAGLEGEAQPLGLKCSAIRGSDGGNSQEPVERGSVTAGELRTAVPLKLLQREAKVAELLPPAEDGG